MSPVVTLRVRPPDLVRADPEAWERLQKAANAELSRLRACYFEQSRPVIETVLAERLEKVTGGRVVEHDLPQAAQAVHRGQYLVVQLADDPDASADSATAAPG